MAYYLPKKLWKPLDEYRARRKTETGKTLQRTTAITELLAIALEQQPKSEELPTFAELVRRVEVLEDAVLPQIQGHNVVKD